MSNAEVKPVSIYDYIDYRQYLLAIHAYLKRTQPKFSDRYFAKMAGIPSSSHLRLVLQGKRNLKASTASKFALGLKLSKKETRYFETMVLFAQAKTEADRDRYFGELAEFKPKKRAASITADKVEYAANSLYVILREMTVLPGFKEDPLWISNKLYKAVTPLEVKEALLLLERLKLVKRDAQGKLVHSRQPLESPPDAKIKDFIHYHRQVLSEAKEAITDAPFNDWDVNSKTIAISKEMLPEVMKKMREFQDDLDKMLQKKPFDYYDVFQMNMQLFPVTRVKGEK
ncbi:TIGR02147 family protein [bacterium]|nr:TIGR02147 family protein [bacterium]